MVKLVVSNSDRKGKRFKAVFTYENGKTKTSHFGLKNPKKGTYIDHKDKEIRKNYRARHDKTEKKFHSDFTRPSTLSRFVLWGDETNLKEAIKSYKNRFNLS
jgi:hypothetical protein